MMATERELETLVLYSTPGLRKSTLSRFAKKAHLATMGIRGEDAEKILNEMYPDEIQI